MFSRINNKNRKNNLISRKSRGGLIQPSDEVIKIAYKCETEIRCAIYESKRFIDQKFNAEYLTNKILKQFIHIDLFNNLNEHMHDQSFMENHAMHLIRTIIQKYVKVRLHYIALSKVDKSKSQRQFFNKLVLFKNQ